MTKEKKSESQNFDDILGNLSKKDQQKVIQDYLLAKFQPEWLIGFSEEKLQKLLEQLLNNPAIKNISTRPTTALDLFRQFTTNKKRIFLNSLRDILDDKELNLLKDGFPKDESLDDIFHDFKKSLDRIPKEKESKIIQDYLLEEFQPEWLPYFSEKTLQKCLDQLLSNPDLKSVSIRPSVLLDLFQQFTTRDKEKFLVLLSNISNRKELKKY